MFLIFDFFFQAIAFGLYIMPLNFMWEKLWGVHQSHYLKRIAVRIPIGCLLWLLALMFPFFGPLNSMIGSLFMSFSVFIIPTLVYTYTFWTPAARQVTFLKQSHLPLPKPRYLKIYITPHDQTNPKIHSHIKCHIKERDGGKEGWGSTYFKTWFN